MDQIKHLYYEQNKIYHAFFWQCYTSPQRYLKLEFSNYKVHNHLYQMNQKCLKLECGVKSQCQVKKKICNTQRKANLK